MQVSAVFTPSSRLLEPPNRSFSVACAPMALVDWMSTMSAPMSEIVGGLRSATTTVRMATFEDTPAELVYVPSTPLASVTW